MQITQKFPSFSENKTTKIKIISKTPSTQVPVSPLVDIVDMGANEDYFHMVLKQDQYCNELAANDAPAVDGINGKQDDANVEKEKETAGKTAVNSAIKAGDEVSDETEVINVDEALGEAMVADHDKTAGEVAPPQDADPPATSQDEDVPPQDANDADAMEDVVTPAHDAEAKDTEDAQQPVDPEQLIKAVIAIQAVVRGIKARRQANKIRDRKLCVIFQFEI